MDPRNREQGNDFRQRPMRGGPRRRGHWLGEGGGPGFGQGGPGFGPGRGGRGPRRDRGDVRAAVLMLLVEQPMHGYEIIRQISDRSEGNWQPSPGAIYPTLQLLQDEGLIAGDEVDGKKVFTLTGSGLTAANELKASRTAPWDDATANAGEGPLALRKALVAVVHGIKQVSLIGTPDQQTRAAALLDQARKGIYGILAEDADSDA